MRINLDGNEIYLSTGGRKHETGKPFVVFLHGAGFSHYTWVLQARAVAYDGYNVIAPDMPGHGLSKGEPIEGVEAQAEWTFRLLDALGADKAVLAGHSQGGLIALEMARMAPGRVTAIAFVATAAAIPVNEQLIALAGSKPEAAYSSMVDWAHGSDAHLYDNTWPGASHVDFGFQVMKLADPKALVADLRSCANYTGGAEAAKELTCPVLCIFAVQDKMTPLKFGQKLAASIPQAQMHVIEDSGHTIPTERPREVNALLRRFLGGLA